MIYNRVVRISLAITPYFTNGDTPPLGMTYLNAALSEAGHDVRAYDLIYYTLRDHEPFFAHFRKIVNLGQVGRRAPFFLNPEFTLYALYHKEFPKHKWPLPADAPSKAAWAACALMLDELSRLHADLILESAPRLILFSSYTSNVFSTLSLAREIRRRTDAPIIIGGPGVGLPEMWEWVLAAGFADGVVVGEGERTIVELANASAAQIAAPFKLPEGIPGLVLPGPMSAMAQIAAPPERALIKNLDELPPPRYEGLPGPGLGLKDYEAKAENPYKSPFFVGLPVMASRGCANRCAYCSESAYWRGWRRRGAEALAQEIANVKDRTGRDVFLFCDSALNLDPEWLEAFCDAVAPVGARFLSYTVAHRLMTDALARKMHNAGWRGAVVGVETFSERLRRLIKKNMSKTEAMDTLRALARADIWVKANILCGFPTETEEDVSETISAMEELNAELEVKRRLWWDAGHPLRLEPYSEMYRNPGKYNIRLNPYRIELPSPISNQQALLDRLTMAWDPGFPLEIVTSRSRRIIAAADNPT